LIRGIQPERIEALFRSGDAGDLESDYINTLQVATPENLPEGLRINDMRYITDRGRLAEFFFGYKSFGGVTWRHDASSVNVRIAPATFDSYWKLYTFLGHELIHVAHFEKQLDLTDPFFSYRTEHAAYKWQNQFIQTKLKRPLQFGPEYLSQGYHHRNYTIPGPSGGMWNGWLWR
jgi:hypothetical protein